MMKTYRWQLAQSILLAMGIACGGKAVIDGEGGAGGNGAGGTGMGGNGAGGEGGWCGVSTAGLEYVCISALPDDGCLDRFEAAPQIDAALGECPTEEPEFCSCDYVVNDVPCGPDPGVPHQCCFYVSVSEDEVCEGRPFFVGGVARTASPAPRADWQEGCEPSLDGLDAETRSLLADAWRQDALAEHASIASFARFVLELLAVGAPPDLVQRAQQAMADEVRHAAVCFGFASAYGGEPVGPGPLAVDGGLERRDLATIAAATAREGCINETLAALVVAEARDAARDPVVHAALAAIAEDEAEHARLAWAFVAWACAADARARAAVAEVFATATAPRSSAVDLREHGQLGTEDRLAVVQRGLREVVLPCARALLERGTLDAGATVPSCG